MLVLRKTIVALSGLFLCLFLTVHLGGNLILLLPPIKAMPLYNAYADALGSNPFIKIVAYGNYAAFIFHVAYASLLTWRNRQGRKVPYAKVRSFETSSWSSRNMGVLGTAILAFLVIHLGNFWYKIKFGDPGDNLYAMVVAVLGNPYFATLYVIAMIPLGFHLSHGIVSAFRSLGLFHRRYLIWLAKAGVIYSVILSIGFALIPLVLYLR